MCCDGAYSQVRTSRFVNDYFCYPLNRSNLPFVYAEGFDSLFTGPTGYSKVLENLPKVRRERGSLFWWRKLQSVSLFRPDSTRRAQFGHHCLANVKYQDFGWTRQGLDCHGAHGEASPRLSHGLPLDFFFLFIFPSVDPHTILSSKQALIKHPAYIAYVCSFVVLSFALFPNLFHHSTFYSSESMWYSHEDSSRLIALITSLKEVNFNLFLKEADQSLRVKTNTTQFGSVFAARINFQSVLSLKYSLRLITDSMRASPLSSREAN